jgi:hypothetical protein
MRLILEPHRHRKRFDLGGMFVLPRQGAGEIPSELEGRFGAHTSALPWCKRD